MRSSLHSLIRHRHALLLFPLVHNSHWPELFPAQPTHSRCPGSPSQPLTHCTTSPVGYPSIHSISTTHPRCHGSPLQPLTHCTTSLAGYLGLHSIPMPLLYPMCCIQTQPALQAFCTLSHPILICHQVHMVQLLLYSHMRSFPWLVITTFIFHLGFSLSNH